ncbi:hypothetical protein CKA32_006179 [Geitlerinema sp. FC II]|nr:CRISPR-associated protein Csx18 [Geitlerinema sp. CS-897]PPT10198.1 hypothetical protein CKA32_006179 [Geitlerinema sp. FC II]
MMSRTLAKQLTRYRSVLVALANAGITWIILIVAPLGLFSVILCTGLVFTSSLALSWLGDKALISLLRQGGYDVMSATRAPYPLDRTYDRPLSPPDEETRD